MGMAQWPLWRTVVFRNVKALFDSPKRVCKAVQVSEMSIISLVSLPMATGWMTNIDDLMTWLVQHAAKGRLKDEKDQVQLICDRTYVPLDPYGEVTPEARENLQPLTEIARMRHAEKRVRVIQDNKHTPYSDMMNRIITWSLVIIMACIMAYVFKGRG